MTSLWARARIKTCLRCRSLVAHCLEHARAELRHRRCIAVYRSFRLDITLVAPEAKARRPSNTDTGGTRQIAAVSACTRFAVVEALTHSVFLCRHTAWYTNLQYLFCWYGVCCCAPTARPPMLTCFLRHRAPVFLVGVLFSAPTTPSSCVGCWL